MPQDEIQRLQEVDRYLKLEISREADIQEIAEMAARICNTPIALITLIDQDTQYIKFKVGTQVQQTSRADAFCSHVITQDEVVVIKDTGLDERFKNNKLRTGEANIQFYAGAPLKTQDGVNLGSLCVLDHTARALDETQIAMLSILAKQVIHILEFDMSLQVLKEQYLEAKKNETTLRCLSESSPSCQMLVDKELKLLYFNKSMAKFIFRKYGKEIAVGQPITAFIGDDLLLNFNKKFALALAGENVSWETHLKESDGTSWWHFCYSPARDSEGDIIGATYYATDNTDLKTAKVENIEHEQMLKAIAFVQTHEIRRPVSSILGLMELVKLDEAFAGSEEIQMMDRAVSELDGIIKRIVSYSGI